MSLQPLHTPSPRVRGGRDGTELARRTATPCTAPCGETPALEKEGGLRARGGRRPEAPPSPLQPRGQGEGRLRWWFAWRGKWGGAGRVEVGPARGLSPSRGTPEIQSRCPSGAGRRGGCWPAASINAPQAFPFHLEASHRPACLPGVPARRK